MSEENLTDGLDTSVPDYDNETQETTETPEVEIPEGFDDNLYDVETKTLRMDKVKERFDSDAKQIESFKKQALDMRRKLSKGVETPKSLEEYEYTPDAKYDKYMLEEDSDEHKHIAETFNHVNQFCLDNGLTLDASKNLKSMMLEYMEAVHILDTRTDEEKAKDKAEEMRQQRLFLGENAGEIIKENVSFYRDRGPFNREERIYLMEQMSKSGVANSVYRKMREFMNTGMTTDIPVNVNESSDVDKLRAEYMNVNTPAHRREQIIRKSIEEGWKLF